MFDYLYDEPTTIEDKNGNPLKVSSFRKREAVSTPATAMVRGDEYFRLDLLADRLVGGIVLIDRLVDANDKDILSFEVGEKIKYARS